MATLIARDRKDFMACLIERKLSSVRKAKYLLSQPLTASLRHLSNDVAGSFGTFDVNDHVTLSPRVPLFLRLRNGSSEIGGSGLDGPDMFLNNRMALNLCLGLLGHHVHPGAESEVPPTATADAGQDANSTHDAQDPEQGI